MPSKEQKTPLLRDKEDEGDFYKRNLDEMESIEDLNEADVEDRLVRPTLERILKFQSNRIRRNTSSRGSSKRPDFTCLGTDGNAIVHVEAKPLGTPLRPKGKQTFRYSPIGQLHTYLNRDSRSVNGTWGILTNGTEWILVRREGASVPKTALYKAPISTAKTRPEVTNLLGRILQAPEADAPAETKHRESGWLELLSKSAFPSPLQLAKGILPSPETHNKGFREWTAPDGECQAASVQSGKRLTSGLGLPEPIHLICMKIKLPQEINHPAEIVNPSEIAENLAQIKESQSLAGPCTGIAYAQDGEQRWCQGFLLDGSDLLCTALVEPSLPGSRAHQQFLKLEEQIREGALETAAQALETAAQALSSKPLQRKFFSEIGKWFKKGRKSRKDLAHLIRVLFAWLLQERGILPEDSLWDPSVDPQGKHDVHDHLQWLFNKVLAVPPADRARAHPSEWKRDLTKSVPYLNGSLFNELPADQLPTPLDNEMYTGPQGLFRILEGFDWTLCDKAGYQSESALDPSVLGDIFEQMIVITEGPRQEGSHVKMPHGTYYTPQDVTDEMASDAVSGWVCQQIADPSVTQPAVKALLHPMPQSRPWEAWAPKLRDQFIECIKQIKSLDPCCGSGAFTLAMLRALRRAQERLAGPKAPATEIVKTIIERQLYAADIHPLAVLITRLRLFIAWIEAYPPKDDGNPKKTIHPLPNLETRLIAANTLCLEPDEAKPLGGTGSQEWDRLLEELRSVRESLVVAHYPKKKEQLLHDDRKLRKNLLEISKSHWGNRHGSQNWLEHDLFSPPRKGINFDIRKLFPSPKGGWDIVIGNPPYQSPDTQDRKRGEKLGYIGFKSDLYLMFIEAALAASGPEGCISLIVPHSIVFRRSKPYRETRELIEGKAKHVDIRTYDNRPKPVFPNPHWLKEKDESGQRATILTVLKSPRSKGSAPIRSSGIIRLKAEDREEAMQHPSRRQVQPALGGGDRRQWTQAPTPPLAELLKAMHDPLALKQSRKRHNKESLPTVTFPPTARYFITCLPQGTSNNPRLKPFALPDELLHPWVGLYNSHLFHAYWLMVGDVFHITAEEYASVRRPPGWNDPALLKRTEVLVQNLIAPQNLKKCKKTHTGTGGTKWPNHDFHSGSPELIEELDKTLLEAYRLPESPLLKQMQIIREGSSHDLL